MNDQWSAIGLGLLLCAALVAVAFALFGCTINVERVQVGPDSWGTTSQPTSLEDRIWEDFET